MNGMKFIKRIVGILIVASISGFLITSSSCKKEEECAYPDLVAADISGSVLLFDDAKNPMDKNGMLVSIVGSIPLISDTTDADGNFTLENVDFGNYTLSYSKDGYGTFLYGVAHQNDCKLVTEVQQFYLGKRSTTAILSLSAEAVAANMHIDLTVNPAGTADEPRYVRLFFKKQSDVSNSSYDFQSGILFTESNALNINLSPGDMDGMGFVSGETIYLKAYGESYYSNEYYDFFLDRVVFPNTSIVTVPNVEFIVP